MPAITTSRKVGIVAAATVILALASFGLSLLSAGAGHGSYLPFAVLFPFGFLSVEMLGGEMGLLAGTLMAVQFPVYGIVLGRAWLADRLLKRAVTVIITHVAAAAVCAFIFYAS